MRYENMEPAIFLERPNRFVAYVEQAGRREICHVKNTGRCRELLVPGAPVYLAETSLARIVGNQESAVIHLHKVQGTQHAFLPLHPLPLY